MSRLRGPLDELGKRFEEQSRDDRLPAVRLEVPDPGLVEPVVEAVRHTVEVQNEAMGHRFDLLREMRVLTAGDGNLAEQLGGLRADGVGAIIVHASTFSDDAGLADMVAMSQHGLIGQY